MRVDDHDWVTVRGALSRSVLADASLVLVAVGIPHGLSFDGHEWCLRVPPDQVESAQTELATYQHENRASKRAEPAARPIDSGWLGALAYLLVIWALPWLEQGGAFGWAWRELGWMEAGLVREGAWWRTVTALTLHADLGHMVGNSLFGVLFGVMAGRLLGSGVAWLLILLGGMLGNLLNAFMQPDMFRSVGASTATFAALAIVAAVSWRRGYFRNRDWRRSLAPVFGGFALLVYTGMGGANTDVMAHITGFASGFLLGVWAARWPVADTGDQRPTGGSTTAQAHPAARRGDLRQPWLQWSAGFLALGLVGCAWLLASRG